MNHSKRIRFFTGLTLTLILICGSGCSSASRKSEEAAPQPPVPSSPEKERLAAFKAHAVHPYGFEISDVKAIFNTRGAPTLESLADCDSDYIAEMNLARNREELFMTLPEHIRQDPEKYHWCFYAKILKLEEALSKDLYVDEKQKILVKQYPFFVHIGRIFLVDFDDPRYLEFATHNYKRLKSLYFNG